MLIYDVTIFLNLYPHIKEHTYVNLYIYLDFDLEHIAFYQCRTLVSFKNFSQFIVFIIEINKYYFHIFKLHKLTTKKMQGYPRRQ